MSDSFVTPWAVGHQAPLSMGSPRQEHWSGLSFPSQRIFLIQGLNLHLLHWQAHSLSPSHQRSFTYFKIHNNSVRLLPPVHRLFKVTNWSKVTQLSSTENHNQNMVHSSQSQIFSITLTLTPLRRGHTRWSRLA